MFSGYGGASFALKKAGIPHEVVGFSEIDKFAVQCYEQNHCKNVMLNSVYGEKHKYPLNFGDCTKINTNNLPEFDLLTGGFPCQAFSVAGKGLGELDTRGTLFNDIIRIAEAKKPKYMVLENVKGLLSKRHKDTFNKILSELDRIGYDVKYKVLNTKEHGIPQNRERVFFICFNRCELLESERVFAFPKKQDLKLFLKDIIENDVDKKYFLSNKAIERILFRSESGKLDDLNGTAKTITACNNYKGGRQANIILVKNATKKGYIEAYPGDSINLEQLNSKTRRGRVQAGISSTLQCNDLRAVLLNDYRIRKLTPKECFRLMGFLDDGINLNGLSNTQRYKLAGNGWDINLVSKIFINMFALQR